MLGEFSLNNMKITFMGMLPTPKFLSYVLYVGPVRQYRYLTLREFSLNNTKIAFMGMLPTPKFLLYVPYVGPILLYIAMYCRTGIHTDTYNRNFRVQSAKVVQQSWYSRFVVVSLQFLHFVLPCLNLCISLLC